MDVIADIKIIREILELSQKDFADKIGVSFETVNRWENGKAKIGKGNIEAIYNFAYENEIYLNEIYEQIIKEEAKKKNTTFSWFKTRNCFSFRFTFFKGA